MAWVVDNRAARIGEATISRQLSTRFAPLMRGQGHQLISHRFVYPFRPMSSPLSLLAATTFDKILAQVAAPATQPESGFGHLLYIARHLGEYLSDHATSMGVWFYVIVFAIVLAETGIVLLAFLPGDSLLFVIGTLCAQETSTLNVGILVFGLIVAAIVGDTINYHVGKYLGPKVLNNPNSRWLNPKHIVKAHEFYERYGGKAIVLARFIPIVRTFAPFIAGVGTMSYTRFMIYNIVGGIGWIVLILGAGYFFGNIPVIKNNFSLVTVGIIVISVLPLVWEWWVAKRRTASTPA